MIETTHARLQPTSMRRRLLTNAVLIVLASTAFCCMGWGLWWWIVGSNRVTTTDALVGGRTAQITPLISAPVRAVLKRDTDAVRAGEVLVVLDDAKARAELDQAEAELDRAIRRQQGYDAKNAVLEAQIAARVSERARLEARIAQTGQADAMVKANLASVRTALAQAHANQNAARAALVANRALTSAMALKDTREIALARAKRDAALRSASRALLRTPISGVVARQKVQIGQLVAVGSTLLIVVPVEQLYVDAVFEEAQLHRIKPGQKAELTSQTYGGSVTYHGPVVGLSGSSNTLAMAHDAVGKGPGEMQRRPVRIRLEPTELRANPLAIGTAMTATVMVEP
jgi:membrane fusion protein (multidrug efflux system)